MILKLSKDAIVALICGTIPDYSLFKNPIIKQFGHYLGGFNNGWEWELQKLKLLSDGELVEIFEILHPTDVLIEREITALAKEFIGAKKVYEGLMLQDTVKNKDEEFIEKKEIALMDVKQAEIKLVNAVCIAYGE